MGGCGYIVQLGVDVMGCDSHMTWPSSIYHIISLHYMEVCWTLESNVRPWRLFRRKSNRWCCECSHAHSPILRSWRKDDIDCGGHPWTLGLPKMLGRVKNKPFWQSHGSHQVTLHYIAFQFQFITLHYISYIRPARKAATCVSLAVFWQCACLLPEKVLPSQPHIQASASLLQASHVQYTCSMYM